MIVPRTQALGTTGLMLLGIYWLAHALSVLVFMLGVALGPEADAIDMKPYVWSQLFVLAVYGAVGAGLLLLRYPLAGALLTRDDDFRSDRIDAERLEVFVVSLVGLWLVVQAVLGEVDHESSLLLARLSADPDVGYPPTTVQERWSPRLTHLVQAAIGLWLLLGASGARRSWTVLRGVGRDRS